MKIMTDVVNNQYFRNDFIAKSTRNSHALHKLTTNQMFTITYHMFTETFKIEN